MYNYLVIFLFILILRTVVLVSTDLTGELLDAGVNRSPSAYLNNPVEERSKYKYDVDKDMTLLKFVDDVWGPVGSFNWFATHGTSMSRTNSLISGDNKGAAARFMEDWFNKNARQGSASDNVDVAGVPRRVSTIIPDVHSNRELSLFFFPNPLLYHLICMERLGARAVIVLQIPNTFQICMKKYLSEC